VTGAVAASPPRDARAASIAALVQGFDAYFDEHRGCGEVAGGLAETSERGVRWAIAWMTCAGCGLRWERRLAV
jgi:hypothetical protein